METEKWFSYYQTRYEAENVVWQGFFQKISFLVTAIALVCSAWVYGITSLKLERWYDYIFPSIGGLLLIPVLWFLFWMIYDCAYQPMQSSNDIREWELKDGVSSEMFGAWLINEIANATTVTREVNRRRSSRLYKAQMYLFFSVVMFILYAISEVLLRS